MTNKLAGYKEGDTITVKVFRDEGLASQMSQNTIDLSKIGDGQYIDLTIVLRIVDDQKM